MPSDREFATLTGRAFDLVRTCERWGQTWGFPLWVAGAALLATVSMSAPVTAILVMATMMAPRRWRSVAIAGALGSAIGSTGLLLVFHHVGWTQVLAWFPGIGDTPYWRQLADWIGHYGLWALFVVAALPMPQTPAIVFLAMHRPEILPTLLAILAGKLLRYAVVCGATAIVPRALGGLRAGTRTETGTTLLAASDDAGEDR